jgi:Tannase and feruloyl esterase
MVFEKPDWDFRRMNFDTDVKLATAKMGQALDATDTNLDRFKASGGKLIQVHGWSDTALPPAASIQYYEAVAAKMGGVPQTQSFYRLFMAAALVRTPSVVRLACRHPRRMRHTMSWRRSRTGSRMVWLRRRSWPRNIRTMTREKASRCSGHIRHSPAIRARAADTRPPASRVLRQTCADKWAA